MNKLLNWTKINQSLEVFYSISVSFSLTWSLLPPQESIQKQQVSFDEDQLIKIFAGHAWVLESEDISQVTGSAEHAIHGSRVRKSRIILHKQRDTHLPEHVRELPKLFLALPPYSCTRCSPPLCWAQVTILWELKFLNAYKL